MEPEWLNPFRIDDHSEYNVSQNILSFCHMLCNYINVGVHCEYAAD